MDNSSTDPGVALALILMLGLAMLAAQVCLSVAEFLMNALTSDDPTALPPGPPPMPHGREPPPTWQLPPPAQPEEVIFRPRRLDATVRTAAPTTRAARPPALRRGEYRSPTLCRICGLPFGGARHDDCNAP